MKYLKAAGCLSVALLLAAGGVRAEVIEQILVKVNGEIFTKSDLETRQVAALRQMGQQADQKSDLSDAQLRKMLDEATPQLLVSTIDEMLLVQRGRELGYKMTDEQFQSYLENIKKENKIESENQFQAALKQENMTMADLRRNLERQMLVSRVQQNEVLGKISVSDDEARQYYQTHLNEFTAPQTITLREIFINISGANPTVADDNQARDKAEQIRKRALDGESFEKLAADLSDSASRANAGLIGPFSMNDISAELRKLLEPMKQGDITSVLRGQKGYQILKLETSSTAQTTPFEQAREDINNRVFTDKRKVEYEKYMDKMRAEAIIEWKNAELKKAYDLGLQQAKTAPPGQ